jgi:two-component system OmpR family response regulator
LDRVHTKPEDFSHPTFTAICWDNVVAPDDGNLLVVDDELFLREAVAASLRFLGFEVTAAGTGLDALHMARNRSFDLLILDVLLPDIDGFEIVRRLRRDGNRVPVIFLTAKDAQEDKVTGLTIGGDDYMTKPFGLEELAARVRTVLRRTRPVPAEPVLSFGDLTLDQDTYEVRRDGRRIELSPTEFRLLRFFMLNPGRVLTRAQLLDHVWDYDFGGSSTIVSTYVTYLRRKLASDGPDLIHTQRAVGYSLRLPRPNEPSEPVDASEATHASDATHASEATHASDAREPAGQASPAAVSSDESESQANADES